MQREFGEKMGKITNVKMIKIQKVQIMHSGWVVVLVFFLTPRPILHYKSCAYYNYQSLVSTLHFCFVQGIF